MRLSIQIREDGRGFVFICFATAVQVVLARSPWWTVFRESSSLMGKYVQALDPFNKSFY